MALLDGDPATEGPFVIRLKMPDGYRIPPHTLSEAVRITVLAGTFNIGIGKTFSREETRALPAGTYGCLSAASDCFAWAENETVIQLHGNGPWKIDEVERADTYPGAYRRRTVNFTDDSIAVVRKNVENGKAVLVDVRSIQEWDQGSIEGSVSVPVNSIRKHSLDLQKLAKTLPPKREEKILYTFCVVGMRAKQAAKILEENGYKVRALQPGYEELLEAGFKKADEDTR